MFNQLCLEMEKHKYNNPSNNQGYGSILHDLTILFSPANYFPFIITLLSSMLILEVSRSTLIWNKTSRRNGLTSPTVFLFFSKAEEESDRDIDFVSRERVSPGMKRAARNGDEKRGIGERRAPQRETANKGYRVRSARTGVPGHPRTVLAHVPL